MKKAIVLLFAIVFALAQSCSSQTNQQIEGCFLLKTGEGIVYYNYDDEELDESTPVSLFLYDTKKKKKETLLSSCIYWDCAQMNCSTIVYTDGMKIFVYDLLLRERKIVYSVSDKNSIVSKLESDNNVLFCFETNYSNDTCTLKSIYPHEIRSLYTMFFSPYESSDISSTVIDNKIIFRLQNVLAFYDTIEKQIKSINLRATDFSSTNNILVYSYLSDSNKKALREYNLLSEKEREMTEPPFKLYYHNFHFRTIDGDNQIYYRNGTEIYLYQDSMWGKENIDTFFIYKDEDVKVFLDGEKAFVVQD